MDLAQFESKKHADEGVDFPLFNIVTGEKALGRDGKPITFRLGHIDGSRIRSAVNARRKARDEERKAADPKPDVTEEGRIRDACDDVATMTVGWSDNFDLDGQPCKFSQATCAAVYFRFPEIFEQMARNAGDRVNFMLGLVKP